jgi:GMP synthase-like glutamine amidotransferase
VNILAVIHGDNVRAGVFAEPIAERGDELEEWSLSWGTPPPRPLDAYGAVLVFGGAMHADHEEHHPWLRDENFLLQRLLGLQVPMLGVCLGAQLIAKASHADVGPSSEPEVGWYPVELTEEARDDELFGSLPERFDAFQWHYYTHGIPAGAVELARSPVCTQAFRLGDRAWGIQFHAEVTEEQIESWADEDESELPMSRDELLAQTREHIADWNDLGRNLCASFLEVADRVGAPA